MSAPVAGHCMCGAVAFEVDVASLRLYRCHCSLCRRASGTASNCAAIVDAAHFRWRTGQDQLVDWARPSGYRATFCATCGSPAPRPLATRAAVWVPAGALDDAVPATVVADFSLASRARWDDLPAAAARHDAFPDAAEFFALMHPQ